MYVFTQEGFWVQKGWISEISWSKKGMCWLLYTKQETPAIIYTSKRFKTEEEGEGWLKEQFKIENMGV